MGKRANGEGTVYKRKDGRWCASYHDENCKRKYLYGRCRKDVEDKLTKAKLKMSPKCPNAHFDQLDDGIPIHINSGNYYNYFIFENLIELELIPTYYCNGEKMFTLRIKPTKEWIRACDYTVSQSVFAEDFAIVDGETANVSTTVAGLLIDIVISHVSIGLKDGPTVMSINGYIRSSVPTKEEVTHIASKNKDDLIRELSNVSGEIMSKDEFIAFTDNIIKYLRLLVCDIPAELKENCDDEYMDKWDKVRREFKKKGKVISRFSMNFLRDYYGIPFSVKVKNGFYMVSRITDM